MRRDIFLHSLHTGTVEYSSDKTLELLDKILKSGALLSPNLSGETCHENFCGSDYISLSDYEKRHLGKGFRRTYNSYYQYSVFDPSIMFPKDSVDVIEPIILPKIIVFYSSYRSLMRELGMGNKRYSDLEDEVQVKNRLSLDNMCGFTMPTYEFIRMFKSVEYNSKVVFEEVLKYKELFNKYGYDIPFFDINTEHSMDTYDDVYETVMCLKRKF